MDLKWPYRSNKKTYNPSTLDHLRHFWKIICYHHWEPKQRQGSKPKKNSKKIVSRHVFLQKKHHFPVFWNLDKCHIQPTQQRPMCPVGIAKAPCVPHLHWPQRALPLAGWVSMFRLANPGRREEKNWLVGYGQVVAVFFLREGVDRGGIYQFPKDFLRCLKWHPKNWLAKIWCSIYKTTLDDTFRSLICKWHIKFVVSSNIITLCLHINVDPWKSRIHKKNFPKTHHLKSLNMDHGLKH